MTTGFKTLSKALSHSSILSQRSQSVPFGSLLIKAWTDYSICPSPFKPSTSSLIFRQFCRKGYGIQRKMIIGSILGVQAPTTAEKLTNVCKVAMKLLLSSPGSGLLEI